MDEMNWWKEENMEKDIPIMSEKDVGTCITAILRQERFCDGLIQNFLEKGILIKLLDRLNAINNNS
jgi:hypothetical protein